MRLRRRTHGSVSTEGLLSRLSHVHPDLDGLQIFQVMRDTPHGITLRARRLGEAWSVAIKLYGGPDGTAKAGRCYDQHRHAFSLLQSNPRLSVPEPLAQFDEPAGYAMRYVAGRSGDAMLRRAIFRRQRTAGELVDRAARWLRAFRLSSGLHTAPLAPRRFIAQLDRRLDRMPAGPSREAFVAHLNLLRETVPLVRRRPFPISAGHGDFNLQNVIVEGTVTWSIDFAAEVGKMIPISVDVACCLFFLEFRDRWRIGSRVGSPGGFDAAAISLFTRAYPEFPWQSLEAAWLLLQHQLRYWSTVNVLGEHAQRMLEATQAGADLLRVRAATRLL